ncbi:MAG: metal-sensitive transcriptional regulator [Candidatus Staskawiczbacteria bacterium]|nr:metal-sensitive transcriptional regulator [Candidatus Staskawiczbacteria bacterium]
MKQHTTHNEQLIFLKKIEGQVRGVQKMIEEGRYCVDILNQVHSIIYALARIEDKILEKHFEYCVTDSVKGKSVLDKKQKLAEVLELFSRFRKI